jgi:hypothetical protein
VVIWAEQWWPGSVVRGVCQTQDAPGIEYLQPHVHTLEGVMLVSPGDWIVTGVHGEQYPVKSGIFEQTYEPAGGGDG